MKLHKAGSCTLCKDAGSDFDYCRACGFTVLNISGEQESNQETGLALAVKKARGGDAPPKQKQGYA